MSYIKTAQIKNNGDIMFETSSQANRLAIKKYIFQLKKYPLYSFFTMILPGAGNVLVFYMPPLIVAAIITKFSNEPITAQAILPYVLLFAGVWMLGEILWRIGLHLLAVVESRAIKSLYNESLQLLSQKEIGFFHNNFAGSLTKKSIAYGKNFERFTDTLALSVFSNFIPITFALCVLATISPVLSVLLITMLIVIGLAILPLIKKRQKLVTLREASSNKMAGHIADVISNMDTVQAYAREDFETTAHGKYVDEYVKNARKSWDFHNLRIDLTVSPLYVLTNALGLALALLLGSDSKEIAVIFVTFNYFAYSTRVLWEFNRIYRVIEESITEAAQFTELILDTPEVQQQNGSDLVINSGSIEFDNITFGYSDSNETLFKELSFTIKPGERVALVGHSGSGKTSITKLLLRFKEINSGSIKIDGQDIADINLESLRRHIGYVPQEPMMFHRTIEDNIRYGNLNATKEEIIAAAKKANAHEFIVKLPNGYGTYVGERGVKLSGGQRQRIAIARAIIKDAPILILDEATSALDTISEQLIQDALWKLLKNRTAIVIAHRLSTIQKMDRIILIEDGKIIESGSHKTLLAKKGTYATLWKHQSGGFLVD